MIRIWKGWKLPWPNVAPPFQESQRIFVVTLILGALCGLVGVAFHLLLDFAATSWIYRIASLVQDSPWVYALLILTPALGGLLAGVGGKLLDIDVRGSGIPQVKTTFYLDRGRMSFKSVWTRIVFSTISIGSGASLGREGPTIHICSGIGSLLGRLFGISGRNLRGLVPVGAAAGLAAAFNTPIAAVTFALEGILGDTDERPLGSIIVAAVIAGAIERMLLGGNPVFDVPEHALGSPKELLFYFVLGVAAGFVAAGLKWSLLRLRFEFCYGRLAARLPPWSSPAVGGLVVGIVGAVCLSLTSSSGVFGVGFADLSAGLRGELAWQVLVVLGVGKLIATVWSYASGGSGGLMFPVLFIGAMLGGVVGTVASSFFGSGAPAVGAFAMVGMASMFAGAIGTPVTAIIMIFEMTSDYSLILPLMLAGISSYVVARRFSATDIYDDLLLQDGIHLPHQKRHLLRQIAVDRAMTTEVVTVRASLTVDEAIAYVQSLPRHYHGYPVLSEDGALVGLVTFEDLKQAVDAARGDDKLESVGAKDVVHAHADHSLDRAIYKLGRRGVSQLPVVDRRDVTRIIGILTMKDIAEAIAEDERSNEADLI